MTFLCDRCKKLYSIADDQIRGKTLKIRCESCAKVSTVHGGQPKPVAPADIVSEVLVPPLPGAGAVARTPKTKQRRAFFGIGAALLALLLVPLLRCHGTSVPRVVKTDVVATSSRGVFDGIPDADVPIIMPDANVAVAADAKVIAEDLKVIEMDVVDDPGFKAIKHVRARYVKTYRRAHPGYVGSDQAIYKAMMESASDPFDIEATLANSPDPSAETIDPSLANIVARVPTIDPHVIDALTANAGKSNTRKNRHPPTVSGVSSPTMSEDATLANLDDTQPRTSDRRKAAWMYAISGVMAGGAIAAGLESQSIFSALHKDIIANHPRITASDPRFNKGSIYAIAADVAYGIAGLSFLSALYYTFRHDDQRASDGNALAIAPAVAPGYAGVNVELHW